jgi:uncharacterized repeat protein (TIGR03803 family)
MPNGAIYGTTIAGGVANVGMVFRLKPTRESPNFGIISNITFAIANNSRPTNGVIADQAGALYGATANAIYKLTPPAVMGQGWVASQLHSYNPTTNNGYQTLGELIFGQNGVLYGTTSTSGFYPSGLVFSLTHTMGTNWHETILHQFAGGPSDGAQSTAGLIAGPNGVFYGTTGGGGSKNFGTVFRLKPPPQGQTQWTLTTLYNFKGNAAQNGGGVNDGSAPTVPLLKDQNGNLYGLTNTGGLGMGIAFRLSPPGQGQTAWTETILHKFAGQPTDGAGPYFAGLTAGPGGVFYGTTPAGGSAGKGVVFKLSPPGQGQTAWAVTVLHSFTGQPSDGDTPNAALTLAADGTYYGTTSFGGTHNLGTVFQLTGL